MPTMLTWIRQLLAAPVFEDNEDKTRIAGLLNVILLAIFVAALILTLLAGLLGATDPRNLVTGAATAILALAMWFIARRGYVQLVSVLLSSMLLVNGTIAVYFAGTIRAPIATVYVLCIVIAGLLISNRAAVVFNVLSLLALLGLFQAETAGLLPLIQVSVGTTQWVTYAATFSITTVLLGLAIHSINEALERARRNERALVETNESLQREIAERKRAEEALRESEEKFRNLAEQSPNMIFINREGRVVYANKKCERVMGYKREEFYSPDFDFFTLIAPEYTDLVKASYSMHIEGEDLPPYEYALITKDGERIEAIITSKLIRYGEESAILGIVTDITERKRAEEALRENERFLQGVFDGIQDGISVLDRELNIVRVNRWMEKMYASEAPLVSKKCYTAYQKRQSPCPWCPSIPAIETGEAHSEIVPYPSAEKPTGWIDLSAFPLRDADGQVMGVVEHVKDITEQKKLEEQLRQAQKMEAIGTLAGGIAHDFNNILTGILGFASLVHSELPTDSPLRSDVETIIRSARRASELTRQLLTFARRGRVEVRPLNLNDIAREVVKLLERTLDKAIAIEPHLADNLATIEGDAGQLHQMLLNLCLNARDAMPNGGQLIIETQNATLSQERAHAELDLEAGQYVLLSVTDTGIGMKTETQQRLFEPFFTTKEHGRGLGLAMAYGIVRSHGGAIHVYSEPGQGSTFKVYLPVASRPVEDTAPEEAEVVGGTETVLVVDDEESVRALLRRILEEGGYTVLPAADGIEAVELYTKLSTEIDLVVLDIIMPRMGGWETYERLREINPEVKVLLSSGYSENGQAQDILAAGARGFLQKPYDPHAVLCKVREVLD